MFGLLERHSGIVVLHDFYLSGVLSHMENASALPNSYCRALYLAHGYPPLVEEKTHGRIASLRAHPCNKAVLDRATGVIVHSTHAVTLARQWYGPQAALDWQVVPLLRKLAPAGDRTAARGALAVADDDFMVCSFGMLATTKCNETIVEAWLDSDCGRDPRCHLVFVGELANDEFGIALRARVAAHPRIRITGHVDDALYRSYLSAADAAVQLRRGSRGETSAGILDCLANGLPTIVNAHGSAVELPDGVCVRLADAFSVAALRTAIDGLRTDSGGRQRLAAAARSYMQAHSPARAGALMRDAIEACTRDGRPAAQQRLIVAIGKMGAALGSHPSGNDRLQAAAAIGANRPPDSVRRLLVDVTHLTQDASAIPAQGQQRALLGALVMATLPYWRIEPVRHDGTHYRYARRFTLDLIGREDLLIEDAVADPGAGDILLGIEPARATVLPPQWRARGVRLQPLATRKGTIDDHLRAIATLAAAEIG
jgi:glycosyltransferase involved in cell wall biosynthesis